MKGKFFALALMLSSLLVVGIQVAQAQDQTYTNSLDMEFVLVPAGKFTSHEYQREVTISKPFYLGKYEVTQEQWMAVMGSGSNLSHFKGRTRPVEMVSWEDVQVFIQKLNEKESGEKYRLPTEAEWEYAARAGSDTKWFFGDDPAALGEYAWFSNNSHNSTHPVGQKKPNPLGLYDIYGNVLEWVQDWYASDKELQFEGTVTDPTGPSSSSYRVHRVLRGGGYRDSAGGCRSASRHGSTPDNRHGNFIGFRLALSPE